MIRFLKLRNMAPNFLILVIAILGWMYGVARNDIHDLRDQVSDFESSLANQREQAKTAIPPSGETDTSNWIVAENGQYRFSVRYPEDWVVSPRNNNLIVPARLLQNDSEMDHKPILSLTISSNTEVSSNWQTVTLSNGTKAFYSFDDGFDHYYMSNGGSMLIWSIPARSYNGVFTDNEIQTATQIVNTFQTSN